MNIEQVEGQLAEFDGNEVSVILPIRGTVLQTFYGRLEIKHDWENYIILYSIKFYPDVEVSFQAHDVQKIILYPYESSDVNSMNIVASIVLKGDTWLEQPRFLQPH